MLVSLYEKVNIPTYKILGLGNRCLDIIDTYKQIGVKMPDLIKALITYIPYNCSIVTLTEMQHYIVYTDPTISGRPTLPLPPPPTPPDRLNPPPVKSNQTDSKGPFQFPT